MKESLDLSNLVFALSCGPSVIHGVTEILLGNPLFQLANLIFRNSKKSLSELQVNVI